MAYKLSTVMPDMPPILEINIDDISTDNCRQMWCEVIYQAWRGAFPRIYRYGKGQTFNDNQRADMRRDQDWFGSGEFYKVCEHAGVEAGNILAEFNRCMLDLDNYKGVRGAKDRP